MNTERRTTRSRRKLVASTSDYPQDEGLSSKNVQMSHEEIFSQPPPTPGRGVKRRHGGSTSLETNISTDTTSLGTYDEDLIPSKIAHLANDINLSQPPPTPGTPGGLAFDTRKTRRQKSNQMYQYPRYGGSTMSLESTSSVDPSLGTFPEHENVGFDIYSLLNSDNNPYLTSATADNDSEDAGSADSQELHTPNRSPNRLSTSDVSTPLMCPDTPMPMPGSSGDMNPPTPCIVDDDDHGMEMPFDTHSYVGPSSLANYGPPPTPACPPLRVGPFSSSLLFAHLPNFPIANTSASAALPLNILGSDEEENDINEDNESNIEPKKSPCSNINGSETDHVLVGSTKSPDITNPVSLSSTQPPSSIKNLHWLRIRAPSSRSCQSKKPHKKKSIKTIKKLNPTNDDPKTIVKTSEKNLSLTKKNSPKREDPTSLPSQDVFKKPFPRPKMKFNFLKLPYTNTKPHIPNSRPHIPNSRPPINVNKGHGTTNSTNGNKKKTESVITPTKPTVSLDRVAPQQNVAQKPTDPTIFKKPLPPPQSNQSLQNKTKAQETESRRKAFLKSLSQNSEQRADYSSSASYKSERYKHRKDPFVRDGNIIYTHLTNFMTHVEFEEEWNPNVNFIHGMNGSGKSAILNSFMLVFGGKATNTQRTSSVKNLIRKGERHTEIIVKLTNYNGSLPKSTYGEEIILSRKINQNGSSAYHVSDANGGRKKINQQELAYITYSLQIDPNNPVQFLTQDKNGESAKVGSGRNVNKDRFRKFMDSTQLTMKDEMLKESTENLEAAKKCLVEKEEIRKVIALQTKQLKDQFDQILKLEKSENLLFKLRNELNWASVKKCEEELQEVKEKTEQIYLEIKKLKEDRKRLEDEIRRIDTMKEENQNRLRNVRKQAEQLLHVKESKLSKLRDFKRKQNQVQLELKTKEDGIKQLTKEIKTTEGQMKEETINYEEQNQKHYKEIERCEALLVEKEKELKYLWEKKEEVSTEINEFRTREYAGRQNLKKLEAKLKQTQQELNKMDNFGVQMKELLKLVNNIKDWRMPPVGPLGAHILVKEARYAPLIERILSGALFAFVVQTKEDFSKLKILIHQVYGDNGGGYRHPTIVFFPGLNVNEYMVKLRPIREKLTCYKTVLGMLTIKDPLAVIGVIEKTNCERVILFDDYDSANSALVDINRVPQEVSHAYTLEWYKVNVRPFYQFHPLKPMKRTTEIISNAKMDANSAIHTKVEIKEEKEALETCKQHLKGFWEGKTFRPGLEQLLQEHDASIQALIKEVNYLKHKIKSAKSCIKEVSGRSEEKDMVDEMKMVSEMKAELEKEILARDETKKELEQVKAEINRLNAEKAEIEREIGELQAQMNEIEGENNGVHRSKLKVDKDMDGFKTRIGRHEQESDKFERQVKKIFDKLNSKVKEANTFGERPEEKELSRDPEEVTRELEDLRAFLDKNKDKLKNKKRVYSEYMNSKALVEQITMEIKCISYLRKRLKPYIKVGKECYERMKENLGSALEMCYVSIAEAHGLTGGIFVDWKEETLVYFVYPDKQAEARANQNFSKKKDGTVVTVTADKQGISNYYNSLSGGERSKALFFYIMAMWYITDPPVVLVDEFENCLDEVSRSHLNVALIDFAKTHPGAQLLIFTPLNIADIPRNDPFIKIILLLKKDVVKNGKAKKRKGIEDSNYDEDEDERRSRKSSRLAIRSNKVNMYFPESDESGDEWDKDSTLASRGTSSNYLTQ